MSVPLDFVSHLPAPPAGTSLGDLVAQHVTDCGKVKTFLDCIPTTDDAALYSPDTSREPLLHSTIHEFISTFVLPSSHPHQRLGPNDRIMVALPTAPENGLALLALACYHTTAPVNATCTASELFEDAERLRAKAVFTTRDAEERLELRNIQQRLGCEIIYMDKRTSGPAGLFDMHLMSYYDSAPVGPPDHPLRPSALHGLEDQSLVLHTSGTSGKKKVVPYTLRSLIVGTCAVIISWDLKREDVNSMCRMRLLAFKV
jgi:acyl-coenzyme A synthetase/AMP-(fatty) acid ligase